MRRLPFLLRVGLLIITGGSSGFSADESDSAAPTIVPTHLFSVPAGLEVTIWAQSPMLRNPTNMDIDREGRIWVAEGVNYRRNRDRDPRGDRITVLADTNGDGTADSSHTFVQEPMLGAPLGIAVIDNQIVVSNAPHLIIYTDVDRDLVFDPAIDKKDILLTGFEGENHDHALHSVTVGPDGLWYFNAGNAGAYFTDRSNRTFRVGSAYDAEASGAIPFHSFRPMDYASAPSDDSHVYNGGFAARMNPDGTNLEVIGHGFRNSYEQTVTSFGDVFQNDNDDPPASRTAYLLEYGNAGFFSRDGTRHWSADRRPGQDTPTAEWRQEDPGVMPAGDIYGAGAPTGIAYYENGALGEAWRGLLLSCEAARNVVFGYQPQPEGAGFSLERSQFFTTNPEQRLAGVDSLRGKTSDELLTLFRPSDVAVGVDGAIYIADWFDPRVGGHADHDATTSGAIYRVAPKGFQPNIPDFDLDTTAGQLTALRSPAVNVRELGAARLRAAGEDALDAVKTLLEDENPYIAARAIALMPHLGDRGIRQTRELLGSDDPQIQIAAYRALRRQNLHTPAEARHLLASHMPSLAREVATSLRDESAEIALPLLVEIAAQYDGTDRTLLEAWGIGATGKETALFEALEASADPRLDRSSDRYVDLVWRLTPTGYVPQFFARAADANLPEERRLQALTALGFIADQSAADAVFELSQTLPEGRVKDTALWWVLNYMNLRWAETNLSEAVKAAGVYDPETVTIVPAEIPEIDSAKQIPVEAVLALRGDAAAGADKAAACRLCHQFDGAGINYGPALDGWVSRQGVEQAILAIVNPHADIAHGYEGHRVALKGGGNVYGIVSASGDPVVITSMGGLRQMIPADRVQRLHRHWNSLMLSADQLGLDAQDVADIVAYLYGH